MKPLFAAMLSLLLATIPRSAEASANPSKEDARWRAWLPDALKKPVEVGLRRNPLQPAVSVSPPGPRASVVNGNEAQAKVIRALAGRIRGVIRGSELPALLIGGRLVFCGDEIPGETGQRGMRLKSVGSDHFLILAPSPGDPGGPDAEILVPLAPYWHAR
jgi:hypothetical protein